jgi:NadR type nicotinamide-nucleotide adenylyltransferase
VEIKKVVITGPESTGKSTLSEALAGALHTVWVPEFARGYLEKLGRPYTEDDLLEIAKGQLRLEDELLRKANKLLICDTDLYVIKVWSEHKYGRCHPWILEQVAARKYDMYLLTDIDIAWQDDPLREHSDDAMRKYFMQVYSDITSNSGVVWEKISGASEERLQKALLAINNLG